MENDCPVLAGDCGGRGRFEALATGVGATQGAAMRVLLAVFLLGALPGLVSSASAGLEFPRSTVEVTGRADQEVIVVEFPFSNTGDQTVTVGKISSSCGCTVPELSKKHYAPGEKGVLTARFTVGDRQGLQTKTITLATDAGTHVLRVSAKLPVRLTAVPRLVIFRPDDLAAKTIELKFEADAPVTVSGVESLHPAFRIELTTIKEGVHYTLRVMPAAALDKAERGNVRIRTKGASGRDYTDMVYVRHAL